MTSVNIADVAVNGAYPVNPYSKINNNDDINEQDFYELLQSAGNPTNIISETNGSASSFDSGSSLNLNNPSLSLDVNEETKGSPKMELKKDSYNKDNKVYDNSKNSAKDRVEKVDTDKVDTDKIDVKEVKEEVSEFEGKVKELLTEKLDISEEDLEAAMETLGLSFVDLTQPVNMAALINEIKGEDAGVNLLLDTNVSDIFKEMSVLTGELFETTGLDTKALNFVMNMEEDNSGIDISGFEMEESQILTTDIPDASTSTSAQTTATENPVVTENKETNDSATVDVNTKEKAAPVEQKPIDEQRPEIQNEETNDSEAAEVLSSKVIRTNSESSNQGNGGNTFQNNSQANSQAAANNSNLVNMNPETVVSEPQPTFAQAIADVEAPVEVPVYTNVNPADIIEQVVTRAQTTITENVRSMEMELNPLNLGRMFMQVTENDGQVTARFVTQNEAVKTALEGALANLLERLNDQGIKVNAVEVSVGTHEFEQNLEQNFAGNARDEESAQANNAGGGDNRSRGGIHLGDAEYMEGAVLSEEEELTASIMRTYGNTVNFTA